MKGLGKKPQNTKKKGKNIAENKNKNIAEKKDKTIAENKNKKKNKNIAKNTLASPFTLEWPVIDGSEKLKIVNIFESLIKSKELSKSNETCVFGYNAVMRGLEKGSISLVFVNKHANPIYLVKCFVPICNVRSIPIIPMNNLSAYFKETGIKKCLALGFKSKIIQKTDPFYDLYSSCCDVLNFELKSKEEEVNSSGKTPPDISSDAEMTPSRIPPSPVATMQPNKKSLHLLRSNNSSRVFHPPSYADIKNSSSMDFIKLGSIYETSSVTSNVSSNLSNGKKKRKAPDYVETSVKRVKKNLNRKSK